MAKTKKIDASGVACTRSMHVDFDELDDIKGLSVGDTVRIMVKGKVKSLEQRQDWDDPKKVLASLGVTGFTAEVVTEETEFDKLLDDGDE